MVQTDRGIEAPGRSKARSSFKVKSRNLNSKRCLRPDSATTPSSQFPKVNWWRHSASRNSLRSVSRARVRFFGNQNAPKTGAHGWLAKLRDDQRAAKAEIAITYQPGASQGVESFSLVEWNMGAAQSRGTSRHRHKAIRSNQRTRSAVQSARLLCMLLYASEHRFGKVGKRQQAHKSARFEISEEACLRVKNGLFRGLREVVVVMIRTIRRRKPADLQSAPVAHLR